MTLTFKVTRQWVLAGNATFTVSNGKGDHYTFKVVHKGEDDKPTWFISLLTGPDNERDYHYVGLVIRDDNTLSVKLTKKSKFHECTKVVKVANWSLGKIQSGAELPEGYAISGEGRCGRCGKKLTHPDGVNNDGFRFGFGAKCWKIMQG